MGKAQTATPKKGNIVANEAAVADSAAQASSRIQPDIEEESEPKKRRIVLKWVLSLLATLTTLATGSVGAVLLKEKYLVAKPSLSATLFQPMRIPNTISKLQLLEIENGGTANAKDVIVKVSYPITATEPDYKIEAIEEPLLQLRTDDCLHLRLSRLRPHERALVALIVNVGQVEASNVSLVCDDVPVDQVEIRYVSTNHR